MTFTRNEIIDILFRAYNSGIAKGQLIMEHERESEELFDGFVCSTTAQKTAMPSNPTERRELRSERRFDAMNKEAMDYYDLLKEVLD